VVCRFKALKKSIFIGDLVCLSMGGFDATFGLIQIDDCVARYLKWMQL